ncbi:MAG: hypothetical protein ACK4YQ_09420 [Phenylobacterium sp.]|uniref:hypothetical protein n=1 Tax=Phenylobacterium sp. TaxID=1871053 RepID=UPI00391D13CE
MSVVRKFRPKLALTEMMKTVGDISAREALRRAGTALQAMEEDCLNGVDAALESLEAQLKAAQPDTERMYGLASDVVGLCGGLSAHGLDMAAKSLCDYLDRVGEGEALDQRIAAVHVASMRLLHRSAAPREAREEILDGLAKVVARHARA